MKNHTLCLSALFLAILTLAPRSVLAEGGSILVEVLGVEVIEGLSEPDGPPVVIEVGDSVISSDMAHSQATSTDSLSSELSGEVVIDNNSFETVIYEISVEQPLPQLSETTLSGAITVRLNTDSEGGHVTCGSAASVWIPQIDAQEVLDDEGRRIRLIDCPFQLSSSGAGTSSTSKLLHDTAGADVENSFGLRLALSLTPGDQVILSSSLSLDGTELDSSCRADLSGDGAVGMPDLLLVLRHWGIVQGHAKFDADMDDDGIVGHHELLLILSSWGTC